MKVLSKNRNIGTTFVNSKCIISWFINFSCQYFCQGYEYVISSFLRSQIMQAVVEKVWPEVPADNA